MKDQKSERKFTLIATWLSLATITLAMAARWPISLIIALYAGSGATAFLLYARLSLFKKQFFFMTAILIVSACFGIFSLLYLCSVNAVEATLLRERRRVAG